jgi:hypothetical protein
MDQIYSFTKILKDSIDNFPLNTDNYPGKRINIILQSKGIKKHFKQVFIDFFPKIINFKFDEIFVICRELINFIDFTEINFNQVQNKKVTKLFQAIEDSNIINDFKFVVYGDPESTDIDLIIIIDPIYSVHNSKINMNLLKEQLEELKKDISKELDIIYVHFIQGKITQASKGSIKTLNGIIYYTQSLHMPKDKCIEIDPPDDYHVIERIKPTINYIISNLKLFKIKDIAYYGNEFEKIKFIIDSDIFNIIIESDFKNFIKAIFYKISTIILIKHGYSKNQDYYTKKGVAKFLDDIYPGSESSALYFLFRGKIGTRDPKIFKIITDEFIEICKTYMDDLDLTWNQVPINIDTHINFIDIEMQKLFWKSPVKPSKEFIEYFQIMNPEYFEIPSSSIEEIVSFPELVEKSVLISQRSTEWFKFREKYADFRDSKDNFPIKDKIEERFHLIAGAIAELYVMYRVDWKVIFPEFNFINVGIIFDGKDGISPDGFIVNEITKEIIPIEIKCIRKKKDLFTKASIREIKMARVQIAKVKSILCDSNINKGLIAFIYIYDDQVQFEYSFIKKLN